VVEYPKKLYEQVEMALLADIASFDYVIDINSNNVVIRDACGNVTVLNSISDLNNWLKNVRGKKIKINVNVVVTQDLVLTSNEYWIFGEWINANVITAEPNIAIYSFAPLGNEYESLLVGNYVYDASSGRWVPVDASNLKIFAVHADIAVENPSSSGYMPVSIYVMSSYYVSLIGTEGDVVVRGHFITLINCVIRNVDIDAGDLYMSDCSAVGGADIKIVSRLTEGIDNVNFNNAGRTLLDLYFDEAVTVSANSSISISLPPKTRTNTGRRVYIEQISVIGQYVVTGYSLYYMLPLLSGVSYNVDGSSNSIVITNNTTNNLYVRVIYRVVGD
jgi:hypothetical protein